MCKYNLCPKCKENQKCETSKGCFKCMCKKTLSSPSRIEHKRKYRANKLSLKSLNISLNS